MSRKLFAFLLSELSTVRLICKRPTCGGVAEMPIDQLEKRFEGQYAPACPVCGGTYQGIDGSRPTAFHLLAVAVKRLQQCKDAVEIEFVLPDEADAK
jgi:hypothetical protein